MVVVDHDSGRLVWAAAGDDRATQQRFFDLLGAERASRIRLVSADAAEWIGDCATEACENATLCLDPFHIVRWGSQALDVVRRFVWNLLKEQLRLLFQHRGATAVAMLDAWLAWARRCQIPAFVELYHRIKNTAPGSSPPSPTASPTGSPKASPPSCDS